MRLVSKFALSRLLCFEQVTVDIANKGNNRYLQLEIEGVKLAMAFLSPPLVTLFELR